MVESGPAIRVGCLKPTGQRSDAMEVCVRQPTARHGCRRSSVMGDHALNTLAVPAGAVAIWWFGQSSFALKDGSGTVVQIDPFFPRDRPPERFIHAEPPLDEAELRTDYVLLTHDHSDHTC